MVNDDQSNMNISQEFSKSMDQLCYQLSYANVNITPFKDAASVYDFIAVFELATAGLSDEQKVPLLAKGFPPGRYRHWFENNLHPLIKEKKSWQEAKAKLIERFTEPKDRDRHFKKLKKLEFDPEGRQTLTEFVDEVTYAYKKAISPLMADREGDTLLIQHVKASLPPSVVTSLSVYSDYREAKTIEDLNKAVREYDSLRSSSPGKSTDVNNSLAEFTTLFQQLITGMKQEQEATRNTIVAAIKEDRQYYTAFKDRAYRDKSPARDNYRDQHMQNDRDNRRYPSSQDRAGSPGYSRRDYGRRSPFGSPRARRFNERPSQSSDNVNKEPKRSAFNSEAYYKRFGVPDSPCDVCGDMHHTRHCPATLN
jgi:hypothetical protein